MSRPDPTRRRLLLAVAASTLIHAGLLVPWRGWLRDPAPIVVAPHLQAQIATPKPPAPKPEARPESRPEAKPQPKPPRPPAERRTVAQAHAEWAVAAAPEPPRPPDPAPEPTPPAPDEPQVDALVTERPTPPEYPPDARARGIEGCVLAAVSVTSDGSVDAVEIVAAEPPGVFDQAVIDSQKNARYLPARRGAEPVPSRVLAVAGFVLTPERRLNCALRFADTARRLVGAAAPR